MHDDLSLTIHCICITYTDVQREGVTRNFDDLFSRFSNVKHIKHISHILGPVVLGFYENTSLPSACNIS